MTLPKLTQPIFQLVLPSTNEKASFRPMLVKEEKILLIAKQSEDASDILTAVKQVVGNCLIDLDVNTLTLFDLEYVYIKIIASSISNISKVSYRDSEDQKVYDFEIDLNKDVTVKSDKVTSSTIDFINGNDNYSIVLKYPKATLYDDKGFLHIDEDKLFDQLIYRCLHGISCNQNNLEIASFEEFKEWLDMLPIDVYRKIDDYFKNLPTLYCELKYTNTSGKERVIILRTLQDFFTFR